MQLPALVDSRALRAEVQRIRALLGGPRRAEAPRSNTLWAAAAPPRPRNATEVLLLGYHHLFSMCTI